MTMDDCQYDGIRQDVTESLKIAVRYSIPLEDAELVRSEGSGDAADTHSFSNLALLRSTISA